VTGPTSLSREREFPRAAERLREPREHGEVGVKLDALKATDAKRGEAVVVLEPAELAFHGGAVPVETFELVRVASDAGEQPAAKRERHDRLLASATERDDRFDAASLALGIDARVVVALVSGDRLGLETASVERVEKGREIERSCRFAVSTRHASGRPHQVDQGGRTPPTASVRRRSTKYERTSGVPPVLAGTRESTKISPETGRGNSVSNDRPQQAPAAVADEDDASDKVRTASRAASTQLASGLAVTPPGPRSAGTNA
jgi:hypothetical protein